MNILRRWIFFYSVIAISGTLTPTSSFAEVPQGYFERATAAMQELTPAELLKSQQETVTETTLRAQHEEKWIEEQARYRAQLKLKLDQVKASPAKMKSILQSWLVFDRTFETLLAIYFGKSIVVTQDAASAASLQSREQIKLMTERLIKRYVKLLRSEVTSSFPRALVDLKMRGVENCLETLNNAIQFALHVIAQQELARTGESQIYLHRYNFQPVDAFIMARMRDVRNFKDTLGGSASTVAYLVTGYFPALIAENGYEYFTGKTLYTTGVPFEYGLRSIVEQERIETLEINQTSLDAAG